MDDYLRNKKRYSKKYDVRRIKILYRNKRYIKMILKIINSAACKKNFFLFTFGFVQLLFLSWNMSCIASKNYHMLIITAFITNLFFCCSIQHLAFGGWFNKIFYTIGCTFGCLLGTWISTKL